MPLLPAYGTRVLSSTRHYLDLTAQINRLIRVCTVFLFSDLVLLGGAKCLILLCFQSEEAQVKRRKESNEILALPPPVPPPFTAQFQPILGLLQCDVMLHIMELILSRTVATRSRSWSEAQLERVRNLVLCIEEANLLDHSSR